MVHRLSRLRSPTPRRGASSSSAVQRSPSPRHWLWTWEDVVALAAVVGPDGEAVGLDSSSAMIAEAIKRHGDTSSSISFQVGDAHRLPFQSECFEGCRIERTLQHLSDPDRVVAEVTRVLKRGGRAVTLDPDWETLVIAGSDGVLSGLIWQNHMRHQPQPRIGRRLRGSCQPTASWTSSSTDDHPPNRPRTLKAHAGYSGCGQERCRRWDRQPAHGRGVAR